MTITSRTLAVLIALLSFALPLGAQQQQQLDGPQILNNMFKGYSRFTSYQDEGMLVTTKEGPTGGTIEKMPFKTFFKRPNAFRFEWIDYNITKLGRTRMIWFNGKDAYTYWEPDVYEKEESLDLAVAGATGISFGAVNTVSDLMMPAAPGGSRLKRLKNVSLVGEDVFEGVRCFRVKGIDDDEPFELWIGKDDFLLRKVRRERKYDDEVWTMDEVRRKIQIDQTIADAVFNYKPSIALTPHKDLDIGKILNPDPPVWTEFKSEAGGFTVSMPDKPVTQAVTIETAQGRFEQHTFTASHGWLVCMVGYLDLPKQLPVANDLDGFFEGVRDEFIKGVGGKVASESSLTLDGHPGREIRVAMRTGDLRLRLILVGMRLYQVSMMYPEKTESEATFKKFFSSFRLTSTPKPIAALPARQRFSHVH